MTRDARSASGDHVLTDHPILVPHKRSFNISVVVPCATKHVPRLPEIMAALRSQTRAANEVVVVISGYGSSDLSGQVAGLSPAVVVTSPERLSAGAARNRGTEVARGDIVIYQDADDLPHPQRLEIVAALFEGYAIDHLAHLFSWESDTRTFTLADAVARCAHNSDFNECVHRVTNGNVAIARSLFEHVRWPEHFRMGEDQEFNYAVYAHTKRTAVLEIPLLTYRRQFSTFVGT